MIINFKYIKYDHYSVNSFAGPKLKYYIFTKLNQNKYINIDNKKLFKLYEQSLQNKNHGFSLIDKNNKKIQLLYSFDTRIKKFILYYAYHGEKPFPPLMFETFNLNIYLNMYRFDYSCFCDLYFNMHKKEYFKKKFDDFLSNLSNFNINNFVLYKSIF